MNYELDIAYALCLWLSGKQAKRLTQSRLSANFSLALLTKLLKALAWRAAGVFNVSTKVSSNSNRVTPTTGWNPDVSRRAYATMRLMPMAAADGGVCIDNMSSFGIRKMEWVVLCGVLGP